ncbi:MAG: rRNA pseudouridine synthase [Clostridiales Family XIII bacterium]|jgi:23S rRNA pseudouridine2605 synthase|nr:rRNA pseudouridine synthase [Clostridiales Family XIII bacterium]
MRLNKYIAMAGIAGRRKADALTENGNVKVNGRVMLTPGYDVKDGDEVEVNGRLLAPESRSVYIVLNKPKGYITSTRDEKNRPTVMDLVCDIEERIFPVGRLDAATTGLLVMTNDGDLAYRMTHPRCEIYKTYRAKVFGVLSRERVAKLRRGVDIGNFTTAPAEVEVVRQGAHSALVEIRIREGKNRQIRKMFASVGNKVLELERIAVGDVRLGNLKQGHYRKMKRDEIIGLMREQ